MTCTLCPRLCAAERTPARGDGYCRMPAGLRVARAALHQWEEPPISGTRGAGAVFFSGCTLRCCYCQNGRISAGGQGKDITPRRLREIFDELIAQGAHNIELVTATHFLPWILPALEPRLPVPVVYNCGGYERVETLRALEGRVDIYLPDLKYADGALAGALSGAPDYFPVACDAIREMFRQTGRPVYDENGVMQRGVIVRHLVLPGYLDNTRRVLDWLLSEHDAVIIESFGVGGVPEAGGFYESIREGLAAGKTVVLTTQVQNEGSDLTVYLVGHRLKDSLGVLEAYDMTTEAVYAKLMWILARTQDREEIERLFYTPVAKDILWTERA